MLTTANFTHYSVYFLSEWFFTFLLDMGIGVSSQIICAVSKQHLNYFYMCAFNKH